MIVDSVERITSKRYMLHFAFLFLSNREILKDRAVNRTKEVIGVIESEIRAKLKTSMYNVRSHDAGYNVDVANSVEKNFQRAQAL